MSTFATFLSGIGLGLLLAQSACSFVEDRESLRWAGVTVLVVACLFAWVTGAKLP